MVSRMARVWAGGASGSSYLTLDQPQRIDVQGTLSGLDFATGFGLRLSGAGAAIPSAGFSRVQRRWLLF